VKSKQKKFKFSKGEINSKLLERQDLALLESSASYIKNMISTPFGSIRTRDGTLSIDKPSENLIALDAPIVTSFADGFVALNQTERAWEGMTTDIDGDVYASVRNGDIYKQDLGAGNFIATGQFPHQWRGMATGLTGNIYCCAYGDEIFKQTAGSGYFATFGQTARTWTGMTTNLAGDVYACVENGGIYKQTAGAGDFVTLSQTTRFWNCMTTSPAGHVYAGVISGDIYKQTSGAGNFVALNQTSRYWGGMAATPNGDLYACVLAGDIYKQTAEAGDFMALSQGVKLWNGMTTNLLGDVYATESGGDIYQRQYPAKAYDLTNYYESSNIIGLTDLIKYDFGSSQLIDVISTSNISLPGIAAGVLVDIVLKGSTDNVNWTVLDTLSVKNSPKSFITLVGDSYRYLKLEYAGGTDSTLKLLFLRAYSGTITDIETKLAKFVFNNDQKYLLVLRNEQIKIYENDVLVDTVTATGLLASYFDMLKMTQAEDTMVFTHIDMRTKQLQRTFRSQAYTNDPASGSNITLNVASTTGFAAGNVVRVSSSAGQELATITDVVPNTSITVDALALNHTTVSPLITSTSTIVWVFSDYPWTKIPYVLFGSEVTTSPAQSLTPSAAEGSVKLTAGGSVFTADSVGQIIDGGGGRVRITEYESATVVWGYTIIPFYSTAAIASTTWKYITGYEVAWSATRGYPATCLFYQQRLWFLGSKSKPNSFWASRVGQYASFENIANYDNDSIAATISSDQVDQIFNAYANRGIQLFTAGAEWVIPEGSTTPDSISTTKNTSNGSLASVLPVDISGTTLFIEKNGKSLLSFVYTDAQAAYSTESLSLLTDLINNPVGLAVDYNSSQDVGNFLYMVMADGTMAVWCIMLSQEIVSPVRFITDGEIKDVVNVGGDTYLLVSRDYSVFLEKIADVKTDNTIIDVTRSATISGLGDYITVRAYTENKDYGVFTVVDGEITLPETPIEDVYVGLDFDYELISNKIAINGQTENIEKRISRATVATKDTDSLTFCGQTLVRTNDVYDFYGVTGFGKDCRFTVTGTFDYVEILSILLNINYGAK